MAALTILASVVLVVVTAGGCEAGPASTPSAPAAGTADRITLPDTRREFASPSGRVVFVVSTRDGWASPRATGELFSVRGPGRTLLWSRELPQQFGPRFVLLDDLGTVLLLDEWINVRSPSAVLLIDRTGRIVAQHGTDAVQAALQVPMADVVRMARHGWWISAPPRLEPAGGSAEVETAGKLVRIRLRDGQLSVAATAAEGRRP